MKDPVRDVKDRAKQKRKEPSILTEARLAAKEDKKNPQEEQVQKSNPKSPQAKRGVPEEQNLIPNPNPNLNLSPTATVGVLGQSDEDDGGDGKLPFTIGERPEEGEQGAPIGLEPKPQDPVVFLTNLVNGLADKMGQLMQKVSAHDQMIVFAKDVLRAQGVEIPEMTGEVPQSAAATEEGAVPEQGTMAEPIPKWQAGLQSITEFIKSAQGFAGEVSTPSPPPNSDPFAQVSDLLEKVFKIQDTFTDRATRAHEANLKAFGPVISQVVRNAVKEKVPEAVE